MSRRQVVLLSLAFSAAACGGDAAGPGNAPDVEGTWTFFEVLADAAPTVSCDDEGLLALTQDGSRVSGQGSQTGTCTGPDGPVDNSGSGTLIGGRITGSTIAFTFGGCSYEATLIASPPDSMAGTVSCDVALEQGATTLTGSWSAGRGGDFIPPAVSGALVPPAGDTLFVPTDQFRLTVSAEDDRKLLWVGYRLGAPASVQDSVRVTDQTFQGSFELPIPAGWVGVSPLVLFARDAFDRLTEQSAGPLRVYDLIRRPFGTVALGAVATDVEYDAKRNVLYLLEPTDGQVAVLSLANLSVGTPIPVPTNLPVTTSAGMDLSPSGDSLVVAVTVPPALYFINLVNGSTSSEPIVDAGSDSHVLFNVQVAAGRAFAYGEHSVAGFVTGRLWELELATKAQQVRTDAGAAGGGGNLGLSTEFATSGDDSRMLLIDLHVNCVQLFALATGFGACAPLAAGPMYLPSGSSDGSAWLVRHVLYDGALAVTGTPVPDGAPAGVLAPDASVAYYPTSLGFDIVELPTGTVREHVRVPFAVSRLTLLPEIGRIAAWTGGHLSSEPTATDRITVVDLQ